ncbi:MAG: FkbM family methyltransferase [Gammaproteobacteria bacterium]|nr:FkbM family methyltransferase [Gammaproteobacteria bacterium]MCF6337252.1 FkbM family methyltransferase [Gammaproteobacteria bacterium]
MYVLNQKLQKLFKILGCPFYTLALGRGVAAAVEHEKMLSNLSSSVIVDVGANRGQFALVARKVFPASYIYSFEPLEGPAKKYQSVFRSDKKSILFHQAIGPKKDITNIHVSKRDDSSSLLPITSTQSSLFPGTEERDIVKVQVSPLCEVLSKNKLQGPALLKMDVQGFELEALRGCEELIGQFRDIYVECSFRELYKGQAMVDEIIEYLKERSFFLFGVYNVSYDKNGLAIQADFHFRLVTA